MDDAWEGWLAEQFPGFLLPDSVHRAIAPEVAARFFARLGRPDHLRVLQASALVSPSGFAAELRRFVHEEVPRLLQVLPTRTEVFPRRWEGGFQGRLDVRATLAAQLVGGPGTFVTRARRRSDDLPETVLLKHVLRRIWRELVRLRSAGLIRDGGWSAPILECEHRIDALLLGTRLRDVGDLAVDNSHVTAARGARDPAYRTAVRWFERMRTAFDEPSAEATAKLLAEGALSPFAAETRFEIAVVLRLIHALWTYVSASEPGRWELNHGLIHSGRSDVASLVRDDEASIAVYYNQAVLPAGPRDLGVEYYFGSIGRIRPDWTVKVSRPGSADRYVVGEVKRSNSGDYQRSGFSEAVLYRFEYAPFLTGWLKSVLVVPASLAGKARHGDPTIAVGWADWVPGVVVEGIIEGVVGDPPSE